MKHIVSMPNMADPATVLLGAIAQATTSVRIGTMVTPISRRRPWRVAQEVATIDHLSGGRAVLGVGLGWPSEEEFVRSASAATTASGPRCSTRGSSSSARSGRASTCGTRASTTTSTPRCARRPCPFGADTSGITLLQPDALAQCLAYIRAHRESDAPFDVIVSPHREESPADYVEAGATWLVRGSSLEATWPDDLRPFVEQGPPAL